MTTPGKKPPRKKTNYSVTATPGERPQTVRSVRTEPIRVTLDLRPPFHARFKKWCNLAAASTDLPEVAMAPVLRLLVEELLTDQALAEKVQGRLVEIHAETQRTGKKPA
jgi:hypothetical protein